MEGENSADWRHKQHRGRSKHTGRSHRTCGNSAAVALRDAGLYSALLVRLRVASSASTMAGDDLARDPRLDAGGRQATALPRTVGRSVIGSSWATSSPRCRRA